MNLEVEYYSGAGNLFTIIDNKKYNIKKELFKNFAKILTAENKITKGKTEGIIVLNPSNSNNFEVWFFNPDGSSGMMCGNGGRCAINFASAKEYIIKEKYDSKINFIMNEKIYYGEIYKNKNFNNSNTDNYYDINNNLIGIYFLPPFTISELLEIDIREEKIIGNYVNVGTDHFVIKVNDVNNIDVNNLGRTIRYSPKFSPNGVNVNFYSILKNDVLNIRTYERGVENETGACGTGAISTALIYNKITNKNNITLNTKSKNILKVEITKTKNNIIENVLLIGNAIKLGESIIEIK